MKTIYELPGKPEVITCDKHGDYEVKYSAPFGSKKKIWVNEACNECVIESDEKARIDAENKRVADDIENERKRRENARINAGISKRNLYKTFDDYVCTNEGQSKAKNDCMRYVENFPSDKSMIMVGGVGTGKTLLASAMLDKLVDKHDCTIIKVIDLVRSLKATWSKESNATEEQLIDYYCKQDLLIIDEVGSQFGSDTEKLFIFDIIDGRYQDMKPTILISNLDIEGVKECIGDRCVDRLREGGGSMIAFNWKSLRS
jgi:DNA replication protein DnaC